MTGKYASIQCETQGDLLLRAIANELAEANKLRRQALRLDGYTSPLEDEA